MKFSLKDFIELDTTALLAVNGGSDCSSASSSYYGTSSTSSNGQGSSVTSSEYESYRSNYGGLSGTSSCGSISTNTTTLKGKITDTVNSNNNSDNNEVTSSGATCSSLGFIEYKTRVNNILMEENISGDVNHKKYIKGEYMCDDWVAEVLTETGHDVEYYFNGKPSDTVQQHIDGLVEGRYTKSVPTEEGVYVVFMNDGHFFNGEQYGPHAALLVINSKGIMTMYDNSSTNSNGGVEEAVVKKISDTKISTFGYDSFYFQKVEYEK